ncbi:hypothetical protein Gotri_000903, partial [Gossypium trilobum]|nr:hypothetical protein [Gossypium trilobum]
MHPVQILDESQHLSREGVIGSVCYCRDARVR